MPRRLEFRRNANTINYLQKSGVQVGLGRARLIQKIRKEAYTITDRGREYLAKNPAKNSFDDLRQFDEYRQRQKAKVKMGFRVWIPAADRAKVLEIVKPAQKDSFLETLPLNYDENTLDTIRQIDVLWLKGRSMARAFEIEHTTPIYSGILRMAVVI